MRWSEVALPWWGTVKVHRATVNMRNYMRSVP